MKNILIVGKDSYIGNCLKIWLEKRNYTVDAISVKDNAWLNMDFSKYYALVDLAGIVHVRERNEMWDLYHTVNCELTYSIACKAKEDGVKHFIFMSTKGVYVPNTPHITNDTLTGPVKMYGKSKLEGEDRIKQLIDGNYKVSIVRAPMVYGEGCRGNFPRLISLSKSIHFFPNLPNKRSMIYIWNLCEFIYRIIAFPISDIILYPQDKEYCGTLKLMEGLWKARGEKYILSRILAFVVKILMKIKKSGILHTMFADSVYDLSMSDYYNWEYCIFTFDDAMKQITSN